DLSGIFHNVVVGQDVAFAAHNKPGADTPLFRCGRLITLGIGPEEVSEWAILAKRVPGGITRPKGNVLDCFHDLDIDYPRADIFSKLAKVARNHWYFRRLRRRS